MLPHRGSVVIAVALLASCGGTSADTESDALSRSSAGDELARGSGGDGSTSSSPTSTSDAARAACPASYGAGPHPRCTDGDDPGTCTYPEGVCACTVPTWCGGMAPPPRPPVWTCEAQRPACASEGTPCTSEGQSCVIDACGFDRMVCTEGVWRMRIGPRPP